MPMMVMQRRMPKNRCIRHDQRPPNMNQSMFSGTVMHPLESSDCLIVEPNGQRQ